MTRLYHPLTPGLHPGPSVVEAGGSYYLVASTIRHRDGLLHV